MNGPRSSRGKLRRPGRRAREARRPRWQLTGASHRLDRAGRSGVLSAARWRSARTGAGDMHRQTPPHWPRVQAHRKPT